MNFFLWILWGFTLIIVALIVGAIAIPAGLKAYIKRFKEIFNIFL